MAQDMRLGERIDLNGDVEIHIPGEPETWQVEGYDVSPTAVALIIPPEHEVMEWLPHLFEPGHYLMINHELFGQRKGVIHRIFRHKNGATKWVLSFLRKINVSEESE